jgi:hypothetical protein
MDAATVTDTGIADAATITGGTGAAVTTSIATIAAGKLSLESPSSFPLPGRSANDSGANGSRPSRRGRFSDLNRLQRS